MSRIHISFTILVACPIAAFSQANPVVEASRIRQERCKTLVLEYRQTSRIELTPTSQRPKTEVTSSATNRIVINGNKVRVEDNNPAISTGQGFSRHQRIETFDGIESLSLFPSGISSDATPIAIRYEKSPKVEAGIPEPVYLHFRGLDAAFRMFAINTFKATGRMKMIDGVNCAEYERPMMADSVSKIWFDPTKDNVAVRVESEINGRVSHRTIVSYRNNQVGGWTPTHWRTEDLNPDGSPKYVRECEITRLVVNDPVDDREFKVELKPGTYVQDQNTKKDYRVNDDGSLRELSAAEQFGPPKRTTIRQWVARNAWTIVLVASVVLFCLLPVIVRRRARPVASQAA